MFKLYTNIANGKEIDRSNCEQDIIDTIGEYMSLNNDLKFVINKQIDGVDIRYKTINNEMDYAYYITEYNQRLENETCIELKKSILDRQYVKRL